MKKDIRKILEKHPEEKNTRLYKEINQYIDREISQSNTQLDDIYKKAFYNSQTVNLLIDPDTGKIEEANEAASHFYRYSPETLRNKNINDINILSADEIKKEMENARQQKRNHFHFRHRLATGEIKHVEVYSKPLALAERQVLHSVIFDIDEKIKAYRNINRLSTAIVQSPATIVITDLQGTIEYVNPQFTKLTGYTKQEAAGQNPSILKSGQTPLETYQSMWETIKKGEIWKGEFVNKRKDSSIFYEKAIISPIYDENQEPAGYMAIKEDITAQKHAEEKMAELNHELKTNLEALTVTNENLNNTNNVLSEEREQFLSLLNSIPEPAYVADKETYEIIFANRTLKEMVGQDVVGEKCYKAIENKNQVCEFCKYPIIFGQDQPLFWEHYNKKLQKHFYKIDRAIKWTDGREVHFQLAIDITRLKNVENELRQMKSEVQKQNEQLVELNATKDKFFSIIAHDLKNPFNSILGFSEFLYTKVDKYDKETIRKFAGEIYESSRNSYKLLQNLLEWSRSQMGRIDFKPAVYNLFDLLDEVTVMLYSQATAKSVQFNVDVDTDLTVNADRNMISTVLRNLLSNAIKFSYRHSTVEIGATKTDSSIKITVTDHGKGIPEKTQYKLFKISEKITTPGTEQEKGTGLGLLLIKEFVEKHGGRIDFDSTVNKGTTFMVELPDKSNASN